MSDKTRKRFCNKCDRKTPHVNVGNSFLCTTCSGHWISFYRQIDHAKAANKERKFMQ